MKFPVENLGLMLSEISVVEERYEFAKIVIGQVQKNIFIYDVEIHTFSHEVLIEHEQVFQSVYGLFERLKGFINSIEYISDY